MYIFLITVARNNRKILVDAKHCLLLDPPPLTASLFSITYPHLHDPLKLGA